MDDPTCSAVTVKSDFQTKMTKGTQITCQVASTQNICLKISRTWRHRRSRIFSRRASSLISVRQTLILGLPLAFTKAFLRTMAFSFARQDFVGYSGDRKSDHSKSGNIWNPDILKIRFQIVRFSKGGAIAVPDLLKTGPFKIQTYLCWISNVVWQNGSLVSTFRSHLKSGPLVHQRLFEIWTNSDFRSPL